ncbi:GGDEF domain-containing protein [Paraburkholderia caballeronis]|uniref:diguanylate cyclase n=1 Tax=Paraburkholderia caballeronis TaxID=416943 RepID=A0A1H7VTV2_9BURK|nr:diguanylate cyclase [Paraburkholderia caballeronis]PXW15470.1 diguanylate cyclase (GGDEF)-like protein [Paraburkholderia caballeronis]PXW93755.1 diguanylate cyclase (GGDEF)-like protein [Paraburkholderia caballeronis]RAJ88995.1 diguanylate cyclase (GGDEF)-like protein [Paraburkholderia caballeronis]TDV05098.1 diguanylate cyclase (GGDEF)-like protein [Paraburkholderia caballeronis]TDV08207.1 diguanylate cyclase (GGDEF)-like protein [Paraburkholderia caballeronis]
MTLDAALPSLSDLVVERVGFGIFVVDRSLNVLMWNRFMADHSGLGPEQVIGRPLFEPFPDLPQAWLARKVESVFRLGSFAFSSWQQRPYLFRFDHDRPITGGVDYMQQDCTFMPLMREREVVAVCVTVSDVTHLSIMQREREEAVAKLQEYADRDGLTGIANRRFFEARLHEEFSRWQRHGGELSVLLFDLDHFKKINDQFGHVAGDAVLRVMAQRVEGVVRKEDTFGRFGGEEFALLLPATPLDDAILVAEKIRHTIGDAPVEVHGVTVPVTASVGAATARAGVSGCDALIHEADAALYSAKRQGRNRSVAIA